MAWSDFSLGSFINSDAFAHDPIDALKRSAVADSTSNLEKWLPRTIDVSHAFVRHKELPDEAALAWLSKKIESSAERLSPQQLSSLQRLCSDLAKRCLDDLSRSPLKQLKLRYRIAATESAIKYRQLHALRSSALLQEPEHYELVANLLPNLSKADQTKVVKRLVQSVLFSRLVADQTPLSDSEKLALHQIAKVLIRSDKLNQAVTRFSTITPEAKAIFREVAELAEEPTLKERLIRFLPQKRAGSLLEAGQEKLKERIRVFSAPAKLQFSEAHHKSLKWVLEELGQRPIPLLKIDLESRIRPQERFEELESGLSTLKNSHPEVFKDSLRSHPQLWLLLIEVGSPLIDSTSTPPSSSHLHKYLQENPTEFRELLDNALFAMTNIPGTVDLWDLDDLRDEIKRINLQHPPERFFSILNVIHGSILSYGGLLYEPLAKESPLLQRYLALAFPAYFAHIHLSEIEDALNRTNSSDWDRATKELFAKLQFHIGKLNEAVVINRYHGTEIPSHYVERFNKLLSDLAAKSALKDDPVIKNYLSEVERANR